MTAVLFFYCFELTLIPVQIWFKYWVSNNWKNYFEFLLVDFAFSHHMLNRNQSQEYGSSVFSLNCQTFFKVFTTLQWNTKIYRRRGWSSMWFFLPYTRCITPNLVTSWRCPSPHYCTCRQHSFFRKTVAAIANCRQSELQRIFFRR